MYQSLRAAFIACFSLVLCAILITAALSFLPVGLPAWLKNPTYSSQLEGRTYEKRPSLSVAALEDGSFQDAFEQYVSDRIPSRDRMLMANASLQRALIATAALPFGYDVYPTFYGSGTVYDSKADMVAPLPERQSPKQEESYRAAAEALSAFASAHPDLNMVFCEVDRLEFSGANPASGLISDPIDRPYMRSRFLSQLPSNLQVVDLEATDKEAFVTDYFRSDHHWNVGGAYKGYTKILDTLLPGATPVTVYGSDTWDNIPFFGSNARLGLCEVVEHDVITDLAYDESDLSVRIDERDESIESLRHRESYDAGAVSDDRYQNRYAEYFHGDFGIIEITNHDKPEGEDIVLIGDSFSNAMERFVAEHYRTTYVIDPRRYPETLGDFVESHPVENVLFVLGGTTYVNPTVISFIGGAEG